jgi:hypothetical protein
LPSSLSLKFVATLASDVREEMFYGGFPFNIGYDRYENYQEYCSGSARQQEKRSY